MLIFFEYIKIKKNNYFNQFINTIKTRKKLNKNK